MDNNGELWCVKWDALLGLVYFNGPCDDSCPALTEEEEEEIEKEKNATPGHLDVVANVG